MVRRFVNQELGKAGKLSAQGMAFLANIQAKLNMPQEVRGNLLYPLDHRIASNLIYLVKEENRTIRVV